MTSINFTELVLNIIHYLHSKPNLRYKTSWTWDSGTVWVIFNHNELSAYFQTTFYQTPYMSLNWYLPSSVCDETYQHIDPPPTMHISFKGLLQVISKNKLIGKVRSCACRKFRSCIMVGRDTQPQRMGMLYGF
jgi:hypothetical protein